MCEKPEALVLAEGAARLAFGGGGLYKSQLVKPPGFLVNP